MIINNRKSSIMRWMEETNIEVGGREAFDLYHPQKGLSSALKAEVVSLDPSHRLASRNVLLISSNFAGAVVKICKNQAAVGVTEDGCYVSELQHSDGSVHFAVYNPKKGSFRAGVLNNDEESSELGKYTLSESVSKSSKKPKNGYFGTVLVLSILPDCIKDMEFKENFEKVLGKLSIKNGSSEPTISDDDYYMLTEAMAIASDNMDIRIGNKELKSHVFVADEELAEREVPLLKRAVLKSKYQPHKAILGEFKYLSINEDEIKSEEEGNAWDKYKLAGAEEYADSPYLPVIDKSTVTIPDYVEEICMHICGSPKFRNIGLRGSAGGGKSLSAKIVAGMLKIPHYIFTCSANTEISDLTGTIIPSLDKNGETLRYTYAESPLLKAVRNGGVLELQEINVASPGVTVGLNGIMEPNGTLVLPTGEVVKRHPNCIIFITTNVSYEGCRDMNVSLLDRLDLVFDVNNPSVEDMVERVKVQTGFTDMKLLTEMAQIVTTISELMATQGIEDGTAGLRSLINWVESVKLTGDPYRSGVNTLISKTSANKEDRDLLEKTLKAASFASRKRARKI